MSISYDERAGSDVGDRIRKEEPVSNRIRRLQMEAKVLAAENAEAFAVDLHEMAVRAVEIAGGGEAYPAGLRDLAARVAADLDMNANSMQAILRQVGPRT